MDNRILCSLIMSLSLASFMHLNVVTSRMLLEGDVTVVGLFNIYKPDSGDCGSIDVNSVMYAQAVRWYFWQLNEALDLPISIGFDVFPTCQSDTMAATEAVKVVNRMLNDAPNGDVIAGVIGPETSTGAVTVSRVLSSVDKEYRLPQVGFSATASSLSNMDTYPNFISVIPDDDFQIEALIKSMLSLEWNRIAVMYEETETGRAAMTTLKVMANKNDICIVAELPVDVANGVNTEDINNARDALLYKTSELSTIAGYIFFGSKATANILSISLKSSGLSQLPIGLFSSEIQLDTDTFYSGGSRISKTEGSLAVAPPYRVIEEFKTYWSSIFTDESMFNSTVTGNPWIRDVYDSISGCINSNCPFKPLSTTEIMSAFGYQPLLVQYAITSAHAYALSIRKVHTDYCGNSVGWCSELPDKMANDVLNKLYGATLDFSGDFSFKLQSLSGIGQTLKLPGNGNPLLVQPSYQLYNFQQVVGDDFDFVKVGDLIEDQFSLNTELLRDYADGVTETTWPNVRRGQCINGKACSECIPTDLPDRVIYIPGDVYIIGLVPVYDKGGTLSCSLIRTTNGYQLVEALKYAIDKVNSKVGVFYTIFETATVGLIAINTCNNPVILQKMIYHIHENGVTLPNGEKIDIKDKIVGFVGELGSGASIGAAQVLSRLQYVQISFASTSPTLSDRNAYPYFLRITTPDDAQAKVMIDVVQRLGGDYIQILYSEGAYGEGGLLAAETTAASNKVCIKQKIKVVESGNFFSYYEQLRKFPHAKIVIVFIRSHVVGRLMEAITEQMSRGEFVFIGSEGWEKNTDILNKDINQKTYGSFSVVLELAQNAELHTYMTSLQPSNFRENPWSKVYIESKLNCFYNDSYDKSREYPCNDVLDFSSDPHFSLAPWATAAYVSAISLLTGAGNHLKNECGDVAELCTSYRNNITGLISQIKQVQLDLHGFGVPSNVFNDNGDGNVGYVLYNIQQDSSNPQTLEYRRVGQYPLQGDPTFFANLVVSPVNGDLDSRCPNTQACSVCFATETTTVTVVQTKKDTDTIRVVLGCLLGVTLLVIIILIGYVTREWKKKNNADDIYLHPIERPIGPDYERPPTVGMHQYIPPCFSENFDQIQSAEQDEKF